MTSPSTTWKLTLSYDGTPFCGWQVQPGRATIQGALSDAIFRITAERVLPQGSGRTDAGVHALAQVASFPLAAPIPAANLLRALNRALPPSIRILSAEPASATFHARHSALRKTYEYRIFERKIPETSSEPTGELFIDGLIATVWGEPAGDPFMRRSLSQGRQSQATGPIPDRICPPFLAPFVWDCRWPLALEPMQRAAAHLLGTHDFTSFAATDTDLTQRATHHPDAAPDSKTACHPERRPASLRGPESKDPEAVSPTTAALPFSTTQTPPSCSRGPEPSAPNPIKTLYTSTVSREHDLLLYRVTGSGFLHHMVRNLVGTLVEIGRGSLAPDAIPQILAARIRSAAGPTAPARGLFLVSVDYPPQQSPRQPPTPKALP